MSKENNEYIYYLNFLGVILRAYNQGVEYNNNKFGTGKWFYTEKECKQYGIEEGYDYEI